MVDCGRRVKGKQVGKGTRKGETVSLELVKARERWRSKGKLRRMAKLAMENFQKNIYN